MKIHCRWPPLPSSACKKTDGGCLKTFAPSSRRAPAPQSHAVTPKAVMVLVRTVTASGTSLTSPSSETSLSPVSGREARSKSVATTPTAATGLTRHTASVVATGNDLKAQEHSDHSTTFTTTTPAPALTLTVAPTRR